MTVSAYRFEARKICPFRYDAYGFRCLVKEKIQGLEKANCGWIGHHTDKTIPVDCPLRDGAITIGLLERKYEDDKQLAKKIFDMLSAYVDMKHEAKEDGYKVVCMLDGDTCEYCRQFHGYVVHGKKEAEIQIDNMNNHCKSKQKCRCAIIKEKDTP